MRNVYHAAARCNRISCKLGLGKSDPANLNDNVEGKLTRTLDQPDGAKQALRVSIFSGGRPSKGDKFREPETESERRNEVRRERRSRQGNFLNAAILHQHGLSSIR